MTSKSSLPYACVSPYYLIRLSNQTGTYDWFGYVGFTPSRPLWGWRTEQAARDAAIRFFQNHPSASSIVYAEIICIADIPGTFSLPNPIPNPEK